MVKLTTDEKDEEKIDNLIMDICRAYSELERIGVVRVGIILTDYIEWKVCRILNLVREENPITEGYDAKDKHNKKYQIKYRTDDENSSTSFDNIKFGKFDFLLCAFVNKENYKIKTIYKVPHDTVKIYSKPYHSNSFRWNRESKSDKTLEKVYP